ncbi:MAG: bifunctional methylenetetrahydrofolate dehydrogenase/methenyltetrahydrofolate cyclohydrolase FolD [Pseudomonadota bacterium]
MPDATIIDGKARAQALTESVRSETERLLQSGLQPGLAVVIVGEDPASQVYVRNKRRTAERLGFHSRQHELSADVSAAELLTLVANLNADDAVHGILVQLPLPSHIDEQEITQAIAPEKDVDGFHFENVGKVSAGQLSDAFVPCTPAGCMLMIEDVRGKDLSGLRALVIGRSNIVGKPMANLLLGANATVTIGHSRTEDLRSLAQAADILVAAVGRPHLVKGDWIKPGATVIDVGINRTEVDEDGERKTRLIGDVDFAAASPTAGAITPVPGGVGPMTIAMLMANTLRAARRQSC